MIFHEGLYYYCESREHQRAIAIRRSRTIAGIAEDPGIIVWEAPLFGPYSHAVWAPELHWVDGRWFIYFAADNGKNENHRMWVIESRSADPLGDYFSPVLLETDGWAIDGTVLGAGTSEWKHPEDRAFNCGKHFVWSGWPGRRDGRQNLYAAAMKDPVTLTGPRALLTSPDQEWERWGMPICEAPQALVRNRRLFLVYSASASWTIDYCLGLLAHQGGDVLDRRSWTKHGPVFQKTEDVWGVGHCSFVKSPCQTEDWILYHSKAHQKHGWGDRDVHAKRFGWTVDGLPDFGSPMPRNSDFLAA
jgi:GH43 family beta-xylosidase